MKKILSFLLMTVAMLLVINTEKIEAVNSIPSEMTYNKQEFRGVWVTTAYNLDMPKYKSESQYKDAFSNILDNLEIMHMNAMVFQVKPMGGTFYPSELNPWDRYVTGTEGEGPDGGWDPLAWMVNETHKRGIEFHAWFNPYRVKIADASERNFGKLHPEYVINNALLNPGEPAVQQYIIDTVMEVAENYDIDAIHFDDYFYPYGGISDGDDQQQYNLYNPNNLSRDDWRRENVNNVIRSIKEELTSYNKTNNKAVQLGISPFGIWANKSSQAEGSNTYGGQSYSNQYADTRKWVKEEWVDYIAPQDYWSFATSAAPYDEVVDWWANQVIGTKVNLYIGHGFYRYADNNPWTNKDEIGNQLKLNSSYNEVDGSIFYRYKFLLSKANSNIIYGRETIDNYYKYKVLPKPVENVDAIAPDSPQNLIITNTSNGYKLTWDIDNDAKAYYVYRYKINEKAYLHNPTKIIGVINSYNMTSVEFIDDNTSSEIEYKYYVTAFDRANNESIASGISTSNEVVNQDDPTIIEVEERLSKANSQLVEVDENLSKVLSLKSDLSIKYSELYRLQQDLETSFESLNSKFASVNTGTTNLSNMIDSMNTQINQVKNDINQLYTDLMKLNAEFIEAKYIDINEKIQFLTSDFQDYSEYLASNKTNSNELLASREIFSNDLKEFNSKYNKFSQLFSQFRYNKIMLNEELSKLDILIKQLNEDKKNINNYQETIDKINNLNSLYNQKLSIFSNIESYYNNIDSNKTEIESKKSNFISSNSFLSGKINEISNELEDLDTIKVDIESSIVDINSNNYDINNKIQELKGDNEEPNNNDENKDTKEKSNLQDFTIPIIIVSAVLVVVLGSTMVISNHKK